jgi:hypothetical protein
MRAFLTIALAAQLLAGCKPLNINLGTKDPIKMDPIDIKIRMDVYQHSSDKVDPAAKKKDEQAREARERIYNRQQQIQELKNNRWVVETHRGELQVREKPAGENGAWVEKTVNEENEDRKHLMRFKAEELNLDLHEIQAQFWRDNLEKAYAGEWVEIEDPAKPKMYKRVQKEAKKAP